MSLIGRLRNVLFNRNLGEGKKSIRRNRLSRLIMVIVIGKILGMVARLDLRPIV